MSDSMIVPAVLATAGVVLWLTSPSPSSPDTGARPLPVAASVAGGESERPQAAIGGEPVSFTFEVGANDWGEPTPGVQDGYIRVPRFLGDLADDDAIGALVDVDIVFAGEDIDDRRGVSLDWQIRFLGSVQMGQLQAGSTGGSVATFSTQPPDLLPVEVDSGTTSVVYYSEDKPSWNDWLVLDYRTSTLTIAFDGEDAVASDVDGTWTIRVTLQNIY